MAPFVDEKFAKFVRDEILPSATTRSVLGPALTKRLVLCAPFDDWLDADGGIVLPDGLEPYDDVAVTDALEAVEGYL